MITPTVGRVVWFYPSGHKANAQPLAAIVAHVWSDTCVNLAVFDANGKALDAPPTSVLLLQDGNERPSGGHFCEWMPYQKGQAAKTEKLQEQVSCMSEQPSK